MRKKVTMQEIAERLHISKNSVSQALTGKPGVSEETRTKVRQTADALGYVYRNAARTPYPEGSRNIGLIASEYVFSEHMFFGTINSSMEREIRSRGCSLLIHAVEKQSEEELILPPFVQENKVDGILVLSHLNTAYIRKILQTGLPVVMVDHHHPSVKTDCILSNNRFGAFEAVDHLLQLGHTEIAFVGNIRISPSYWERWEGFRLALAAHGIASKPDWDFLEVNETENSMHDLLRRLPKPPSAWFCANDTIGFLLNKVLNQTGCFAPEDYSIVGFDNNSLSDLSTPPLTTVSIDKVLFGKRAVDRLFWRMRHPESPFEEILLPATLLRKASTGRKQD